MQVIRARYVRLLIFLELFPYCFRSAAIVSEEANSLSGRIALNRVSRQSTDASSTSPKIETEDNSALLKDRINCSLEHFT